MGDGVFVGIDLGTANCCFAYTNGNSKPEILTFNGSDLMPSVVTFTDEGIYVGADAVSNAKGSWNTTSNFKNFIGGSVTRTYNGVSYNTTELSAVLIKKMLDDFRKKTGKDVRNAVITVPSDFGDLERHSTYNAAMIAGLDRVFLLSETLAAAISYGEEKQLNDSNILVYDFGAGTFDAAVINIKDGTYKVLADESSRDLGGRELDLEIAAIIRRKIFAGSGLRADDASFDSEFRRTVAAEAEKAKMELQREDRYANSISVGGKTVDYVVTREEIRVETYVLLIRIMGMVNKAISNSGLSKEDIDRIVIVGCSSTMYLIWDVLKNMYPTTAMEVHYPRYAVSRGAAIFAESRYGAEERIKGVPVMNKAYGILGGIDGVEKVCNMVYKNEPIPSHSKLSCRPKRDDQDILHLVVYESASVHGEEYIDKDLCKVAKVADIPLTGKISRAWTKIPISAEADKYGRVKFIVECNGAKNEVTFTDGINLTDAEISASREKLRRIL